MGRRDAGGGGSRTQGTPESQSLWGVWWVREGLRVWSGIGQECPTLSPLRLGQENRPAGLCQLSPPSAHNQTSNPDSDFITGKEKKARGSGKEVRRARGRLG